MRKLKWFIAAAALAACFTLVSCADENSVPDPGENEEWLKNAGEVILISAEDLTDLPNLAFPQENAILPESFETDEYTAAIDWEFSTDGHGWIGVLGNKYYANMGYRATITMRPKTGYTFEGIPANSFTYKKGITTSTEGDDLGVTITIQYPWITAGGTRLITTNLSGAIFKPVKGLPIPITISGTGYTGTIEWQNANGDPVTETEFLPETAYKAVITITANPGYTLSGLKNDEFRHTDSVKVDFDMEGDINNNFLHTATVSILFEPTTAASLTDPMSYFNLTDLVPAPVHRGNPRMFFPSNGQFYGNVVWDYVDNSETVGQFSHGRDIRATVTLTGEERFSFTGVARNSFYHDGSKSTGNSANSNVVIIIFDELAYNAPVYRYPQLSIPTIGIKACCWRAADNNPEQLISMPDPATGRRTAYQWDFDWSGSGGGGGRNSWGNTTWMGITIPVPTASCWDGHPNIFNNTNVPAYIRKPAHCFTLDLGEVYHNIVRFEILPRINNSPTDSHWPRTIEVFYSNKVIGPIFEPVPYPYEPGFVPDPDNQTIATGVHDLGVRPGNPEGEWRGYDLDNLPTSPETETKGYYGISARYLHLRLYANPGDNQLGRSFSQIRIKVQEE